MNTNDDIINSGVDLTHSFNAGSSIVSIIGSFMGSIIGSTIYSSSQSTHSFNAGSSMASSG